MLLISRSPSRVRTLFKFRNTGTRIEVCTPGENGIWHIHFRQGYVRVEALGKTRKEAFDDLRHLHALRTNDKYRATYYRLQGWELGVDYAVLEKDHSDDET